MSAVTAVVQESGSEGEAALLYERDIIAWSKEQAGLLQAGRLSELDIKHIVEEIEDVGKSEQRELASRMSVLLAHLIKWSFQRERRSRSWQVTIRTQRNSIERRLRRTPSLARSIGDPDWWADAWDDALDAATRETGIEELPQTCPWQAAQVLDHGWLPEQD